MKPINFGKIWLSSLLLLTLTDTQSAAALTTDEIVELTIEEGDLMSQQPALLPENYSSYFRVIPMTANGIQYDGTYQYCSDHPLEVSVSNPEIVEFKNEWVFDYGWTMYVTTKAPGTSTVTIGVEGTSLSLTREVTVGNDLEITNIELNSNIHPSRLVAGAEITLYASLTPYWSTRPLEWSSSNPEVMQVISESLSRNSAKFKLLTPGECDITVRSADNPEISATRLFTVAPTPALESLYIIASEYFYSCKEIAKGLSYRFSADGNPTVFRDKLIWSCSDESVTTIRPEDDGKSVLVTGLTLGTTTLTVTSADNPDISASVTFDVVEPGIRILNEFPTEMYVGDIYDNVYLLYMPLTEPVDKRIIEATVSDPSILSVTLEDQSEYARHYYTVKALQPGVAEVTLTDNLTGVTLVRTITVKPRELENLRINGHDEIFTDFENGFRYTITPVPNGAAANVEWSIDNSEIAAIISSTDSEVYIKASAPGTFVLKATDIDKPSISDSKEITVSATVLELPASKEIEITEAECAVEIESNIWSVINEEYPFEVESSNPAVVQAGRLGGELRHIALRPVSPGEAVVIVRLLGTTVSATMNVRVYSSTPSSVENCVLNANETYNIYNLNGRTVMLDATPENLRTLAPGLYIINGMIYLKR